MDGRTEFEGRVEFCSGETWGQVCDNMWDDADAAVVCRQLGFTSDGKSKISRIVVLSYNSDTYFFSEY